MDNNTITDRHATEQSWMDQLQTIHPWGLNLTDEQHCCKSQRCKTVKLISPEKALILDTGNYTMVPVLKISTCAQSAATVSSLTCHKEFLLG